MEGIKQFLFDGYGSGDGSGDGYGDGYGYGYGYGYGDGSGYGYGYGYGYGDGSGDGYGDGDGSGYGDGSGDGSGYGHGEGLMSINSKTIYYIDRIPTVIERIKGNIAKGYIVNVDMTLIPCFVRKENNLFAHGKTLQEATTALNAKLFNESPVEKRISLFWQEFKQNKKYSAMQFYEWHNKLTGSCKMGRDSFALNNGINLETDAYTVEEFIKLTKDSYGGDIIKQIMR